MAIPEYLLDDLLKTIQTLAERERDGEEPGMVGEAEWEKVRGGDLVEVRRFVMKHPEVLENMGPGDEGIVHWAVVAGKVETVRYLVDMCANINLLNGKMKTPLDLVESCPEASRSDMLLCLVQNGAKRKFVTPNFDENEPPTFQDVGMTSSSTDYDMLEPVVMSPSYAAKQYEALWEDSLEIPPIPMDTISFTDPNTGNELTFFVEPNMEMRYEIAKEKRPPFKQLMFSPHPPRMMIPDIGVCVTLPTDVNKVTTILGGVKHLAAKAGVQNDIPALMKKKKETTHWTRSDAASNLIIVTVMPPGRGKTFISQRLCRWLNWKGVRSRIFHSSKSDFSAISAMLSFLRDNPGSAGILGASKCTADARQAITQHLLRHSDVITKERVLFIDSTGSGASPRSSRYTALSEETDPLLSWVQLSAQKSEETEVSGCRVHINRVSAHLSQKLLYFMLNLNPNTTPIYLVRTGESMYQIENRLGGNSTLTAKGWQQAAAIRRFFNLPRHDHPHMQVFTSTNNRAAEVQSMFQSGRFSNFQYKSLNEINAGECDGLQPEEIERRFPQLWNNRAKDKYNYGWPNGESYQNMNQRLEQVILDIHHSDKPLVVIGHLDVCRGLYAYLSELLPELCIYLTLPQNHIFEFAYDAERHMVQVTAYDLSADILKAGDLGVSGMRPPSADYLRGIPATPRTTGVPSLPPHISDIGAHAPNHTRTLSAELDFTPPKTKDPTGSP